MTQRRDFDSAALNWDEKPRRIKLAGDIATAIEVAIPLSEQWDGLDFGCGTGLVTIQLAPALGSMTGVDSSTGMLNRLNEKIQTAGLSNVRTELCDMEKGEMPVGKYHLITSSMTLHHIKEIPQLLTSLKTLLHPDGWVALADLESEDGSFHEDSTGVFHHGFSREELAGMLETAGFSSISITTATKIEKEDQAFPVFLATAQSV